MKIVHVVGARPNFMKIAPVMKAISRAQFAEQKLVHTGQHYDVSMSDVFFTDLGMPVPDIHLGVGSGSHAEQTAKVMVGFEKVCFDEKPDLVVVAGDVNSTLACAVDCAKLRIACAHVEAGLRAFHMGLPEEVQRIGGMKGLRLCEPLGYLDFLGLTSQAQLVLTDSGGLQEETTALGIPCFTIRENTERPITITEGTNTLVGVDPEKIVAEAKAALAGKGKAGRTPALWDGKASERIAQVFSTWR